MSTSTGSKRVVVSYKPNYVHKVLVNCLVNTPDRWLSKMLLTIDERGSKIASNSVFDCHLLPVCIRFGQAWPGNKCG